MTRRGATTRDVATGHTRASWGFLARGPRRARGRPLTENLTWRSSQSVFEHGYRVSRRRDLDARASNGERRFELAIET